MNKHYPKIRVRTQIGAIPLRERFSLCFYMHSQHVEVAQAVQRALDAYLNAVGPQALGLYTDTEGYWQALDNDGWALIHHELLNLKFPIIQLRDSSSEDLYRFDYYGRPTHTPFLGDMPDSARTACFTLPTEYLEEYGPERVQALALEVASLLPFNSGHAGLAFVGDLDVVGVMREVYPLCFRYPGIDIIDPSHLSMRIGTRIRGPSWLTFLGQPALDGLGGVDALSARLRSPGTSVQAFSEGRALITLGAWPEAGDTEQGRLLPAYRELAGVLEPWLYREEPTWLGFSPEDLRRWERRFLD